MCCADLSVLRVAFGEVFALVDVELRLQIRVLFILSLLKLWRREGKGDACAVWKWYGTGKTFLRIQNNSLSSASGTVHACGSTLRHQGELFAPCGTDLDSHERERP